MKILIADDDLASRFLLQNALKGFGSCDQVVDGIEAVDAFLVGWNKEEPYELITLDIMMPRLGGLDTLRTIRRLEKDMDVKESNKVKIVMTTVLTDAETVTKAFEEGCQAYAAKPLNISELSMIVEKIRRMSASPRSDNKE